VYIGGICVRQLSEFEEFSCTVQYHFETFVY
jgi:hypothetical protein